MIDSPIASYKFDLFVATPMSAYSDDVSYSSNRNKILSLFKDFQSKTRFRRFFCPALQLASVDKFDPNENALIQDFLALESSEAFLFFYLPPLPVRPSSVFVEAGMALRSRTPSVYIVRSRDDLPYMLRQADKVSLTDLLSSQKRVGMSATALASKRLMHDPFVKIIEVGNADFELDAISIADWFEKTISASASFQ